MVRRPPGLTPFPYTTLFRSVRFLHGRRALYGGPPEDSPTSQSCRTAMPVSLFDAATRGDGRSRDDGDSRSRYARSEEHTSELQSRQYLVCRLLLEKKKSHIY